MNETPWFLPTDTPVRVGVYRTKHRAVDGTNIEGYSRWHQGNRWGPTEATPWKANQKPYVSGQQSKAWCGLTEEPK